MRTWRSSGTDGGEEIEIRQWLEALVRMHTHDCLYKTIILTELIKMGVYMEGKIKKEGYGEKVEEVTK